MNKKTLKSLNEAAGYVNEAKESLKQEGGLEGRKKLYYRILDSVLKDLELLTGRYGLAFKAE